MLKIEFSGETADALNAAVKDYVSKLKGTRGGKGDKDDGEAAAVTAPAPMMPPTAPNFAPQPGGPQFAPPAPAAAPGGAFPAAGAPSVDPAAANLVQRITTRLDAALASGQPQEQALGWLRSQIGPTAAAYTMDQCKAAMASLPVPTLTNMAALMNA